MRRPRGAPPGSSYLVLAVLAACHRSQPASGPTLDVHVEVPGATAAEVETSTTEPIEQACAGAAHVAHIRGASEPGHASVTVQLDHGADADAAFAELQGKLRAATAQLPSSATPPVLARGRGRLVGRYTARSEVLTLLQVNAMQKAAWIRRVEGTAGVGAVVTCGDVSGRTVVNVDAQALAGAGMTIADVATSLAAPLPARDGVALSAMIVASRNGAPIRMRDIANVVDDASPLACAAYDERGMVVETAVYAQPSADPEKVRAGVAVALDQARLEMAAGVDIQQVGAGRTVTMDVDPATSSPAARAALHEAVEAAGGPMHFLVELDTSDAPEPTLTAARAILDASDDAVVGRVVAALGRVPIVRSAGEANATVELVGNDRSALQAAAPELHRRLAERGVLVAPLGTAVHVTPAAHVDRERAATLGVATADVALALEALHGKTLAGAGADGQRVPVVLRLAAPLDRVYVRAGTATVPLSAVVAMTAESAPRVLLRSDRMPAVGARVHTTDLASLQKILEPPPGMALRVTADGS